MEGGKNGKSGVETSTLYNEDFNNRVNEMYEQFLKTEIAAQDLKKTVEESVDRKQRAWEVALKMQAVVEDVQDLKRIVEEAFKPTPWWKEVLEKVLPSIIVGGTFLIGSILRAKQAGGRAAMPTKQDSHVHYHTGPRLALIDINHPKKG